ncbi:MAG: cell division ATP-binding protein FtsE [Bacillota bacterium]|uniref:Cell division ATP-binding protein FtsE n=1 Tax=[Clostridium] aminophilum TaxID=1526 RepID=A0A1I6JU34_9FIRM|nr:cell division ATP-binding protein FtsE [[Clostridium] aminophilum]MDT3843310.1 cell division ATP-binding protein FtsE [Bacillota bacterium]SFR82525.1 cell division transport system ATP-binding protein [[Clostridium] aminophilum]
MILLDNVSKIYRNGAKALRGVDIRIEDGEFVFIMGPSGSGKSTLIRLLLHETEPTGGTIRVGDVEVTELHRRHIPQYRRELGVVFQDFRLLKERNVYENVAFAQRVIGVPTKEIRENVPRMLQMVGLSAKYKAFPSELSGGEQQRVAIARALINSPKVLLADEPTGNLDADNSMGIMKLLEDINRRGTTVIVVTHSREIVRSMQKRVIMLEKGFVVRDIEEGSYNL